MTSSCALASVAPEAEPPFDVLVLDERPAASSTSAFESQPHYDGLPAVLAAAGGRCLGCGKEQLIANTMCRTFRSGSH